MGVLKVHPYFIVNDYIYHAHARFICGHSVIHPAQIAYAYRWHVGKELRGRLHVHVAVVS